MLVTSKYVLHTSCKIQSMCQPLIKKHSKADRMKKLMQECNSLFGPLVETNAQKKKRLELEKKGKAPPEKSNMTNTELSWVMENAGNKLKKITLTTEPRKQQSSDKDQSSMKKFGEMEIKSSTVQATKILFHSESNQSAKEIDLRFTDTSNLSTKNSDNEIASSNSSVSGDENATTKASNFKRLPDIVIKNLPSFSIMGSKQEFPTQSTEVLSISGRDDLETIKFPSVTKILMETMSLESKLALQAWKERMIEKLGQEGFEIHQKALLEDGTSLHWCIAQSLLGKEYEVPSRIEPVFKSVQGALEDVHHVKAIETYVAHTKLHYKGVVDCIASYRNENYVIDWKKSDRQKLDLKKTYDAPIQLAAYIGAINASNLYPFVIKRGLLVIAYTCGAPATVYEVSDNTLQQYWTAWLRRLQKYHVNDAQQ